MGRVPKSRDFSREWREDEKKRIRKREGEKETVGNGRARRSEREIARMDERKKPKGSFSLLFSFPAHSHLPSSSSTLRASNII